MANKSSIADLLSQFFGDEIITSTSTNVISVAEEWINHSQKALQEVIDSAPPNDTKDDIELTSNVANSKTDSATHLINLQNLRDSDFQYLFRMTRNAFYDLQKEIDSSAIIDTELLLCLWILGNTKTFSEIAVIFQVKQETVYEICEKYLQKIVDLSGKYVIWPSQTEILGIENGFHNDFNFPGVLGVIGSIHLAVYVPPEHEEARNYYNRNTGDHTIVLQAVCDNNCLFRDIFVGYPGSNSISTILKASPLFVCLTDENGLLKTAKKHLLGGTEHPQLSTLLTPYSIPKYRDANDKELKFNSLHSAVMYTVEKTFRMVENRFQRMKTLDTASPKFATLVAGAICTLHNFTRLRNDDICTL